MTTQDLIPKHVEREALVRWLMLQPDDLAEIITALLGDGWATYQVTGDGTLNLQCGPNTARFLGRYAQSGVFVPTGLIRQLRVYEATKQGQI